MQRNIETDSWESPALRMHVLFMRETLVLGCTNQQAYTYTRTSLLTAALTHTIKAASSNKLQLKMLKFVVLFATVAICATQVNIIYAHRENLYIFFIATWLQDAAPAAPAVLPPVAAEAPVIPAGPPPGPPGPPGDFPMDGSRPFAGGPPTPNPKQCKVNYLKVRFQHKI